MAKALNIENKPICVDTWNTYLQYFNEESKDIYFTEEYVKLYENSDGKSECFIYREDKHFFLFPYIKNKIRLLDVDSFDLETPYGYGGPIVNTNDIDFIHRAADKFYSFASENKIIAGFIRFHPLLNNHVFFSDIAEVMLDRKTIAMKLDIERDKILNEQIHSKHRNAIRKAAKAGLVYKVDTKLRYLDEFVKIYASTMQRLRVDEFYFFDKNYFNKLKALGENIFLGLVFLKEEIISAALFFKYGTFGHYHLSGSLETYKQYNPNNFLIYNTALFLKEIGVKTFHLGGGTTRSSDNTLYRFKRRFSPYDYSFYIGKIIFDQKKYNKICSFWEDKFPEKKETYKNFILKYRF